MLQRNGTGAVIISPTRELAMQTFGVLRELMEEHPAQTCGLVRMNSINGKLLLDNKSFISYVQL